MALILGLETTTKTCSVVLSELNNVIALEETHMVYTHSENLTIFIEKVLKKAGKSLSELSAVAVSKGPGSYMGLRIGVATAKGLCYALGIPLIAVDTLQAMAQKFIMSGNFVDALFCPMLDARRMEVYCALYDSNLNCTSPTSAKIIDAHSFEKELENNVIHFFGDGAMKCKTVLENNINVRFHDGFIMSADALNLIAFSNFQNQLFEDLAYFEPYYLKDFIPGIPKVKGLY
ncbi:MAG: tRNA (adenosine(37)-N6)-threonylcarbamoyltransferase complex dimerization subunit type 1 TsaB [Bacteroidales bacterium]|nr:tRNA (adenosine(37)-N6)-threonylcarbamoyltransferase complex dimerization subunit type 1 TsaB [Bacteroidales bacterium]